MERRAFLCWRCRRSPRRAARRRGPAGGEVCADRVSCLRASCPASDSSASRRALRDLGYVEGQNIVIEYRMPAESCERLPDVARRAGGLKVDVIVASITPPRRAAKQATKRSRSSWWPAAIPWRAGLVASLARPGGNVTGLELITPPELIAKRLELLSQTMPGVHRIAVLSNPGARRSSAPAGHEGAAARRPGHSSFNLLEVRNSPGLRQSIRLNGHGAGRALFILRPIAMLVRQATRIADLALKHRLPAIVLAWETCRGRWAHGLWLRTTRACAGAPPPTWTRS